MPVIDPATLAAWGLPGLFLAAFLAGSVVPLPSEAVLVALLHGGVAPSPAVAVAAAGNVLGAATLYLLGVRFARGASERLSRRIDPVRLARGVAWVRRWGAPALLLSWLPIAGDVVVIAAGVCGVRALPFLVFTSAGKLARFALVGFSAARLLG